MVVKTIANHHVSMTACMKRKLWFLCIDVSAQPRICVYAHTTLLNQGSSGNQAASKGRPFTQCADAEGRASLWFLLPTAYACECWDLSKMPARTPDTKRDSWLHHFDGLNSLKRALLSKLSHRPKLSNLCPFRYQANQALGKSFKRVPAEKCTIHRSDTKMMSHA